MTITDADKEVSPEYWQRGGVRIGGELRIIRLNLSWPFALLRANSNEIRIRCLWYPLRFPKSNVKRLSRYSGFMNHGLHIEHDVASAPSFVVFWSFNFSELATSLQSLGYSVT